MQFTNFQKSRGARKNLMCRTSAAIVIKERGKDQQLRRHPTYCDVFSRSTLDPHAPENCSAVEPIRSEA